MGNDNKLGEPEVVNLQKWKETKEAEEKTKSDQGPLVLERTLVFTPFVAQQLREIQDESGIEDFGAMTRNAYRLYHLYLQKKKAGCKFHVINGETVTEVEFDL